MLAKLSISLYNELMLLYKSRFSAVVSWFFAYVFALSLILYFYNRAIGLTGLGVILILSSVMVEANQKRIWDDYRKSYKKRKGLDKSLNQPHEIYHQLNVYLVWPLFFLLGLVCLWTATRV